MRVAYTPLDEKEFQNSIHYAGNHISIGNGPGDITIFRKYKLNKGHGAITNAILKHGKRILPYLKQYLWPTAKQFGKDVAMDMLSGETTLKNSLKKRGKQSIRDVGKRYLKSRMVGEGFRRGRGPSARRQSYINKKKKKKNPRSRSRTKTLRRGQAKTSKFKNKKKRGQVKTTLKRKAPRSSPGRGRRKIGRRGKARVDCSRRPRVAGTCPKDIFSI